MKKAIFFTGLILGFVINNSLHYSDHLTREDRKQLEELLEKLAS